jgi:hypothetical protein
MNGPLMLGPSGFRSQLEYEERPRIGRRTIGEEELRPVLHCRFDQSFKRVRNGILLAFLHNLIATTKPPFNSKGK